MSKLTDYIKAFDTQDFITILQAINSLIASAQRAQSAKNANQLVIEAHKANESNLKQLEAKIIGLADLHKADTVETNTPTAKNKS